ncbi:hypothetical protein LJR078_001896 [Arthrobacter sp. LjRoot78]|uniref:hypothetical protein n=1 Tax=Arthrobacter sp. LjRoot78 TaxID=3342338 RepID=UPI003ECE7FE9
MPAPQGSAAPGPVLEDPLPFQADLRAAGPVVHLDEYDMFAMGRSNEVHAALTDWQTFQSAAGVGLSNFRYDKPWRPPSLLLEADPPHHDAPRAVLTKILGPREIRRLGESWATDAEELVEDLLARGKEFDAVTDLAAAFPLRVFPDAVGIPQAGREDLLPYGDRRLQRLRPAKRARRQRGAARGRALGLDSLPMRTRRPDR